MSTPVPVRIDRRVAIKWMLSAGAGALVVGLPRLGAGAAPAQGPAPAGYGVDPQLLAPHQAGDYWPLTFTDALRRQAAALCDIILPADEHSPSASAVGVVDFIDEWVSAPYPACAADAKVVLAGFIWLDAESVKRFGAPFADASAAQKLALCEVMAPEAPAGSPLGEASAFFRRFRNLTATGFYTTPVGMKDLGYVGNVPLARFDGPPADLVEKLGLTGEVAW